MYRMLCALSAAISVFTACIPADAAKTKDRFYFERLGYAHWQVPTHRKIVALTFDDGPDLKYTPQILQLLTNYGDHATFFLIGQKAEQYPNVVRQTALLGNELGNHTFSHANIAHLSTGDLTKELDESKSAIERITGERCVYFRPPRGYYDEPSVLTAYRRGYSVIMWSWDEDSRDWAGPGAATIAHSVLNHLHPGDIILLHDGTANSKQTVAALRIILPELHRRGYQSVTVTDLLRSADETDFYAK
ncbi:polysaccharide deacetylase family sporulation protein PdaB [Alicyclobacillus acidoterrestris]|uniref:polysaccharide deacetylase family protein n=1 Tax=Alicyclobacillus suci TaxID=2816080 RepID=UPI00119747A7|nr:polysaccharide deacetylase family protein [Alicyclobacillus suci]GEO26289.1 polysaccharide deacetylase family sporulation protein PdaB [Alicyclobacillus acidoterrestris]